MPNLAPQGVAIAAPGKLRYQKGALSLSVIPPKLLPLLILFVASALAVTLVITRPAPAKVSSVVKPWLVDAIEAQPQSITLQIKSQGSVSASAQVAIASEVAGRVVSTSGQFHDGGLFEQGDVLLSIDDTRHRASVAKARAQVASATAALASEQGRAEQALAEYNIEQKARAGTAKSLALREPQLAEAKARLESAEAELESALHALEQTQIKAPFAGLLSAKAADLGQYVNTGLEVATLTAISRAEVRLPVPDDRLEYIDLQALRAGTSKPQVKLVAKMGDQSLEWYGELVRTEGVIDERSRVLYAVAEIDAPYSRDQPLRIGTFVTASIQGKEVESIVVLPRSVLRTGNRVWVINEGVLESRQLEILRAGGELAYVKNGLAEGELVASSAVPGAVNGLRVQVNKTIGSRSLGANSSPSPLATAKAKHKPSS